MEIVKRKSNRVDFKNGGIYFLVFLGVNFILQKLLPFINSYINMRGNVTAENFALFGIYILILVASISVSTNTLKSYLKFDNKKSAVVAATIFYALYLFIFQLQSYIGDILNGAVRVDELFYLQVSFIIISVMVFYFLSLKLLRVPQKN